MLGNRTYMATKEKVERKWYIVDATDKPLGRIASQVAKVLMGKNKPTYTPHVDTGDFVIIINAEKAKLTGNKRLKSTVHHYTGWLGGFRSATYGEMMERKPAQLMERVVKGMLPRNKLKFYRKLKVYAGAEHPHSAQQPVPLEV
ncbi:MAG: 50S ribosomal protein L13 [Synergistaceae bacterium]|jgi:large subunit ribosomal protein L13|nr:50S ribosomal protein L13 [Synergistaceae bacterium]MDD3916520.1 50S ribosomal protein L13 [Synergistaceae bacterium]NLD96202.1 50S ribosomal protein L13 [Synergistaceae bacterium]